MVEKSVARPCWYVDLKWVFGLLFFLTLLVSFLIYTLSVALSQRVAVPVMSYVVASMYSRGKEGLDDSVDIEIIKDKYLKTKDNVFYPLERKDVVVTREELSKLSPRELRLKIFQQVVEPIYYQKTTKESLGQYGALAIFNVETHRSLQKIFWLMLIPTFLAGIGMVAFSYGWGRLISLGVVLVVVSALPAAILLFIQQINPPEGEGGLLSALPRELVVEVARSLAPVYNWAFLIGVGLFVVVLMGRMMIKSREAHKNWF